MANEKVVTLDNLRKFKEKCDEKYSGGGIEVVDEIPEELSDANLDKLYRERSEDGVDNLQVINKEVTPAGDVTSNCAATKNGTQISNYNAFNGYFDTSLNELYGDNFTVSSFTNVYTAYYPNVDGSPVSAIRIGTKNAGSIVLSNLPEGITKLKLIVGKYFSYNGSTGQKSYDENAILGIQNPISGDGTDIPLEENPTELEIELSEVGYNDGDDIHLVSYGSSSQGRVFLYGFIAEGAESVTFTPKKLATKEEVEAVEEHVVEVEESVDNAHDRIDDVEISLEETNERIGDIQIWKADRLPGAAEQYLDKILKVNNKLYQCIPNPEAGYVFADFSNCTGTNQITAANFEDFQRIVGKDFLNEFELVATENTIDFDYIAVEDEADITVGKRYRIALDEMDLEEEYERNLFSDTGINNATVLLSNVPQINSTYEDLPLSNIDFLNIAFVQIGEDESFYYAYLDDTPDDNACGQYIDYLGLKINSNEGAEYDLSAVPMYEISTITVENDPIAYTFKNNGEIRFGSSSNLGYFYLTKRTDTAKIYVPLTKLVFRVKSWNDSKYSCLKIDFFEKNLDSSKSFSIRRLIAPSLDEQEIVISTDDEGNPLSIDLADYEIKISGDNVHFMNDGGDELIYADRRVRILSVSFIFGVEGKPLFIWQPLGAGEGGTKIEEVDTLPEEGEEGTIYLLPSEKGPSPIPSESESVNLEDNNLIDGAVFNINGIYESISSNRKLIILTNIKVNGEEKHDITINSYKVVDGAFVIELYGLKLTITDEDEVTVEEIGVVIKSIVTDKKELEVDIEDGEEISLLSTNDAGTKIILPNECYLLISGTTPTIFEGGESHFEGETSLTMGNGSDEVYIKRIGNIILVSGEYEI